MAGKMTIIAVEAVIAVALIMTIPIVFCDDKAPIPAQKTQVNSWYQANVKPLAQRKGTLDPALETAEASPKVIKVRKDGSGDFKTVTEAISSIPTGNTNRVIVWIGPGNYTEKIKIEATKPFVTLYGAPNAMPVLVYGGTAAKYGTVYSGTVIAESDYFSAVNIIFVNSAPRPTGQLNGAQATAFAIAGDKAAIYNCKMYGFQDTHLDKKGRHFFKDCYIQGTYDFVFGNGKSIYLNTELHVHYIKGDLQATIAAHARDSDSVDTAYVFVHCTVTGTGNHTALGRAWRPYAKVIYAYTEMSDAIKPEGWSDNSHPEFDKTLCYREYKNSGPGSNSAKRVPYSKQLNDAEAQPYLTLGFIEGSKWLLPPHKA
uniref:pectinesterase n=1 Tax=Davidia involucrata TaxID=16924 RepID=A0A5B6ZZF5_DAVIN